jgi:uncharacterized protein (DUF1697 family)
LRAVNIGAHQQVAMADLRDLLAGLRFADVRTVLQSGNVVFRGPAQTTERLERTLQAAAGTHLGLSTDFFVRTAGEWEAVLDANPFPREAVRDPGHMVVMLLKDAPAASAVRALQATITGRELVRARGRQAYLVYPDGIGRSRLTVSRIERALGTRGTGRNWNTVQRLAAMVGP